MRSPLFACLAGALVLAAAVPASAQHLTELPTARATAVVGDAVGAQTIGPLPAATLTAPPPAPSSSRMPVDCTDGQTLDQTSATFAAGVADGGQELGQSFTAPCTGQLEAIVPVINRVGNETVVWGATMRVYDGDGTTGTEIGATPFTFDNSTVTPQAFFLTITLAAPIDVVEGQVYTWFLDMTSNATGMQGSNADPLPGGDLYLTSDGNPASATPLAGFDMQFSLDFLAPPVETTISSNGVHYRSPPLAGVTVDALAGVNLVIGIPGYAAGTPNLFTEYDGAQWTAPASGAETLELGRAFRWFLRDGSQDFGSGSVLQPLPTTIFIDQAAANTADVTLDLETDGDRYNYLGNPFGVPLDVSDIASWPGGTQVGFAFEWDDATQRFVDTDGTVDPWQAFFVITRPGRSGTLTIPGAAAIGSPAWTAAQAERTLEAKAGASGTALALAAPFPNPTRGTARVPFSLAEAGTVRLTAIDALGREVAVLADGAFSEGAHTATLDTRALPAGTYLLRLEAAGAVATQRATVVR